MCSHIKLVPPVASCVTEFLFHGISPDLTSVISVQSLLGLVVVAGVLSKLTERILIDRPVYQVRFVLSCWVYFSQASMNLPLTVRMTLLICMYVSLPVTVSHISTTLMCFFDAFKAFHLNSFIKCVKEKYLNVPPEFLCIGV